jgi:hypothetical protein
MAPLRYLVLLFLLLALGEPFARSAPRSPERSTQTRRSRPGATPVQVPPRRRPAKAQNPSIIVTPWEFGSLSVETSIDRRLLERGFPGCRVKRRPRGGASTRTYAIQCGGGARLEVIAHFETRLRAVRMLAGSYSISGFGVGSSARSYLELTPSAQCGPAPTEIAHHWTVPVTVCFNPRVPNELYVFSGSGLRRDELAVSDRRIAEIYWYAVARPGRRSRRPTAPTGARLARSRWRLSWDRSGQAPDAAR